MKHSIVHVALVVRDYDEAITCYTEKLGFTLVEDSYQPEQNKRWVVVPCVRPARRRTARSPSSKICMASAGI
jgi:catechol 2,3-dioxygenase-like lactoylglutathione lyase family enzyme